MIVVDTNIIAYFLINGSSTVDATTAYSKDPVWVSPTLWRSELRSVLRKYLKAGLMDLKGATNVMLEAETVMQGQAIEPPSDAVLRLTTQSQCSSYDCEFIALAQTLGVKLVTGDDKISKEFPETAIRLRAYADS